MPCVKVKYGSALNESGMIMIIGKIRNMKTQVQEAKNMYFHIFSE